MEPRLTELMLYPKAAPTEGATAETGRDSVSNGSAGSDPRI